MDIDTGKVYATKEEALRAGVPEDKIVTGTPSAIEALSAKLKLFPKRRRMKLRRRDGGGKEGTEG